MPCPKAWSVGVAMPTRNVVLTEHQERLIENLVESGRYQNASEILREGLRLVEQREAEDRAKLKVLRKAARVGFRALDRGEFKEFDNVEYLQAYLHEAAHRAAQEALLDRALMTVSPKAYDEFVRRLDAKPRPNARLRKTMSTPASGQKG
jgi:antitoxin ParD1/3/4